MNRKATTRSDNKNQYLEWEKKFFEHADSKAFFRLVARGADPGHLVKLLWLVLDCDLVGQRRDELRRQAEQLSMIVRNLEVAAKTMAALNLRPDFKFEISSSQLHSAAEQIREVLSPAIKAHSNRRLYDSTDYLLYNLYAYLKQFKNRGVYREIASLLEAAQHNANVWDEDAVKKRIIRLAAKFPEIARSWKSEQEAYVREGNGGFNLRELFEEWVAPQVGLSIEKTREYLRQH